MWPIGCVALVRHALGTSRLVTYAAGFASAAFIAFPTILLGWGVLWPNLMATALTPGPSPSCSRLRGPGGSGSGSASSAALPGLALIQPNALVALVLFALVWFVTARVRAGLLDTSRGGSSARDLAIVGVVGVVGLVAAPAVSARLASTQSYEWKDRVSVWTALVEVVGGRLQIPDVLWGLVVLIALGIGWIALRARAALPVVAMWAACVVALRHGGLVDDVVDRARHGLLVQRQGPARLARRRPRRRARRRGRPGAARAAAQGARARVAARRGRARRGARHPGSSRSGSTAPPATGMLTAFFRPSDPKKVILSFEAQDSLRRLAALSRPARASSAAPRTARRSCGRSSAPTPSTARSPSPRPATRSSSAPASTTWRTDRTSARPWRGTTSAGPSTRPHVYWLDRPERSSGLKDLRTSTASSRSGPTATTRSTASPAADWQCGHPAATPAATP